MTALDDAAWPSYRRDGFLCLGPLIDQAAAESLCQRADDLLSGRSLDAGVELYLAAGAAAELRGVHAGAAFGELLRHPVVAELAARQYGRHAAVSVFADRVSRQPATVGAWWQDGGDDWQLDRDPLLTVWVALTPLRGLELVRGSHCEGLLQPAGGPLDAGLVAREPALPLVAVELAPGEALALHACTVRRWQPAAALRHCRLLTAALLDGRTLDAVSGRRLPPLFGRRPPPEEDLPFLARLHAELRELRERALPAQVVEARWHALEAAQLHFAALEERSRVLHRSFLAAERYALSLQEANERLAQQRGEAERYAWDLEKQRAAAEAYARDLERHLRQAAAEPVQE